MSLITWIIDKLGIKSVPINFNDSDMFAEYESLIGDLYIREMAFWSAVNLMANAVSKCEFKTYVKGKAVKGPEYYLWNIEPNKNQNSSVFLHKLIAKLYRNNECLVIEQNGQLLVADKFTRKPYALYEDMFEQVQIDDFIFQRSFRQSDVLYFKLSECKTKEILDGLYNGYSKLIVYGMKYYQRSKGLKAIFQYDTLPVTGTPDREAFDKLINEKFKKWLDSDSGILPLGKGQKLEDIKSKTYSAESSRDIRALIDDISDFTAKGFGVPAALLRGDVQDTSKAVEQLLTFGVDPLVDMLQEEIIRKRYGQAKYAERTYIKIDTTNIKHIDLFSISTAIDKLLGSGACSVNDIRAALGEEPIDEPWANQHWITKNYAKIEEVLAAMTGGG